ncbi:MAG: trypsin-like peptidase domain-containing protein [Clostridia bacterium]|nr:trypsin-like peptidase domain-containing protein [Clostridia bacterium]
MDNDNQFSYSAQNNFKQVQKPPKGPGFGSRVVIPFISGTLGACLVGGVCLGIPGIKDRLLSSTETEKKSNDDEKKSTKASSSYISTLDNSSYNAKLMDIAEYSETSVAVSESVLPSVVGITVTYDVQSFGGTTTAEASGSGVIISDDGYIITNNHVVSSTSDSFYYQLSEAKDIKIHLYGTPEDELYDAEIIGKDASTDLAVLKIEAEGLQEIAIGDSSNLRVGEFVMAVGNPLGLESSVSAGIISAIDREIEDGEYNFTTIQTDAAINSGNSGGALVNSKGELIGINFLKASSSGVEGIGFAIPINSAMDTIDDLIEVGYVKKPYIGIEGRNVTEDLAQKYDSKVGIYIDTVLEGTPAEEAGLQEGDVITKIDDHKVETIQELNNYKAQNYEIGDEITLTVYRDNKEKKIKLTLGEQPKEEPEESDNEDSIQNRADTLQDYYDMFDEYYRYFYY